METAGMVEAAEKAEAVEKVEKAGTIKGERPGDGKRRKKARCRTRRPQNNFILRQSVKKAARTRSSGAFPGRGSAVSPA